MMIIVLFFYSALAGAPDLFKKSSFFSKPDSYSTNSLESKVIQLQKIERDFQVFTSDLLEWGKSYHKYRVEVERQMLADVLSHVGQNDFLKELQKCGMLENVETEDMIAVKSLCGKDNKSEEIVTELLKELRTKAETCVNVKEKFRKRIQNTYDEFLEKEKPVEVEVEAEEVEEVKKSDEVAAGFLQVSTQNRRFSGVIEKNRVKIEEICQEYASLSSQVSVLTQSTDSILQVLF